MPYQFDEPGRNEAQAFLEQRLDRNLSMLGSLIFEPLEQLRGVRQGDTLVALAVVVPGEANVPGALPMVLVDALDNAALHVLVNAGGYPQHAVWCAQQPDHLLLLEHMLGQQHDQSRGVLYFTADTAMPEQQVAARLLLAGDTAVDLSPCNLGAMALSYWILRGWRVFGVIEDGRLLGHAVASYPIADTEEVAAVFTAPEARRRGVASACVAAAVTDIRQRGKRAMYVSRKNNAGSIAVAEGLGMRQLCETWEIET